MKHIKIYQIRNIEETVYAFREFDPKHFNMADYRLVVEEDYETHLAGKPLCEVYFMLGNNGELQKRYPGRKIRSISVSDVIEIDGERYYVQNFGFKEV